MSKRHFGSVRRLPSGRYQASYWHEGVRHLAEQTFPTKGDALAHLASIETDLHRGAWIDPSAGKVTFGEWAQSWLDARADLRPVTKAKYQHMLDRHVDPVLGPVRLSSVTPSAVRAWYMDCLLYTSPFSYHADAAQEGEQGPHACGRCQGHPAPSASKSCKALCLDLVQLGRQKPFGVEPAAHFAELCEQMLKAAEGITDSNQMGPIVVREGTQRSTWTDEVVLFHCCLLSGSPINEGQLRRGAAIMPSYSAVTTL